MGQGNNFSILYIKSLIRFLKYFNDKIQWYVL